MSTSRYSNFVRPVDVIPESRITSQLNGEQVQRLYLEEVQSATNPISQSIESTNNDNQLEQTTTKKLCKTDGIEVSDSNLFMSAQNNDVDSVKWILNKVPDKINIVDAHGWSLLMIACQANSVDTVKELLNRNIDTSIRDKAGNSAQSLVIKTKNFTLAKILVDYKPNHNSSLHKKSKVKKVEFKEEFVCKYCNYNSFPNKEEHLSSTVHNINASKDKKLLANYVIPQSNKGYQLMLKGGWDKESGLGPYGLGKKYPIKTVQKKDRKGLGHDKKRIIVIDLPLKKSIKQDEKKHYEDNRRMEINFRREFY